MLVEDDDSDAFLFENVLGEVAPEAEFRRMTRAEDAVSSLQAGDPRADCIVLDLRLRGHDGLWLLDQLLADPALKSTPVVVFSGDPGRMERASSAFSNVVSSVRKPDTVEEYQTALHIVVAVLRAALARRGAETGARA